MNDCLRPLGKPYTPEADAAIAALRKKYGKLYLQFVDTKEELIGRTKPSIITRARKLGLVSRRQPHLNGEVPWQVPDPPTPTSWDTVRFDDNVIPEPSYGRIGLPEPAFVGSRSGTADSCDAVRDACK